MNKNMVIGCLVFVTLLPVGLAGTSCSPGPRGPTMLPADGSTLEFDYVPSPSSTMNYYQINVVSEHSYSIQVIQPYDANFSSSLLTFTLNAACGGSALSNPTNTQLVGPVIPFNAFRESFTAQTTAQIFLQGAEWATGIFIT